MQNISSPLMYPLRAIAEYSFFAIGFGYAMAYFLKSNGLYILECEYYFRLMDSPFLFAGIFYFFLSMRIRSEEVFLKQRLNDNEHRDFFLQDVLYIFLGTIFFFTYYVIDILG